MKLKIAVIALTVLSLVGWKCYKDAYVDIKDFDDVQKCSERLVPKYKNNVSVLFGTFYGEYDFDSVRVLINPNGFTYYMRKIPNNWEIVWAGKIEAEIKEDGKLYFDTQAPMILRGEVIVCPNVLGDVDTKALGYLICKCTL